MGQSCCEVRGKSRLTDNPPPMMATALRPICTTVKKLPGVVCNANTFSARKSPSSAICRKRILRDAARAISDMEKKQLVPIRQKIITKLSNKLIQHLRLVTKRFYAVPLSRPENGMTGRSERRTGYRYGQLHGELSGFAILQETHCRPLLPE